MSEPKVNVPSEPLTAVATADPSAAVTGLYRGIMGQARRAEFFTELGVPDTLDGRFELLALHAFLVMHRLKGRETGDTALSRELYEAMVNDLDRSVREMGVSDLGVGRRVTTMVCGINGRVRAYDRGLAEGGEALLAALDNNLYGTVHQVPAGALAAMAGYLQAAAALLAERSLEQLRREPPPFPPPPRLAGEPLS